jgi:peptidoglycan/LPS O-acetylase OafA/YrhL
MKNVPEFEGLRGFLSTVVVVAHLYPPLVKWVWGSMDIFFCMSGLLIGQLILKDQKRRGFLKEYAWRRITRIWPAYYVTFAACLLLAFVLSHIAQHPPWPPGLGNALSLVFMQNTELLLHPGFVDTWRLPDYLPFMGHTWSVALEEQFYLLAPIICWLLAGLRRSWLGAAVFAGACCTLGSVLRGCGFNWGILPARFDGFAVGVFAAAMIHQHRATGQVLRSILPVAWTLLLVGGVVYILLFTLLPVPGFDQSVEMLKSPIVIYGVSAVAAFSGGLLLLINHYTGHPALAVMRWRPLLSLGRMSYSTYLAHIPVIWYSNAAMAQWLSVSIFQKFLIQLPLCFGAAFVLHVLVERPVMQRRGSARRTTTVALPA